ncbi:cation:proton antiporter subunit C [Thiomicrospira cyclica]|uniref:NADH-ubiquinone oxidoreductase chain 4L n=1 Tax=Thiomicrospira cyclica (strain DSM 14477 / JCM 11371 / ALM1) TaxID=717773 RepID=F6D8Z3_THICA|nr:cation:proton antiporter subunit C [Thiomicrospira cyclica]AEG31993.1 NADH-ubiquinone oxidoreductase chain 4L [Thiomicrospira cyclica ALM1]
MNEIAIYLATGSVLFGVGLWGVVMRPHLLHKILGINVMGSAVFMFFLAFAARAEPADAVPHALVLTGIVVAISAMALALALMKRVARESKQHQATLEDTP